MTGGDLRDKFQNGNEDFPNPFGGSSIRRGDRDLQALPTLSETAGQSSDCPALPATSTRRYDQDLLKLPPSEPVVSTPPSSFERKYDKELLKLPQVAEGFRQLEKQERKIPVPDISQGLGRNRAKADIISLAKYVQSQQSLLVHQKKLYVFKPPCWMYLDEDDAAAEILAILEAERLDGCITSTDVKSIYRRLLLEPALRRPKMPEPPEGTINFLDGTLNILEHRFYEHQPNDYFTSFIDVCWEEVIHAPRGETFEMFVEQISDGNPCVRQQLLELTAVLLTGTRLKYFFVLLGESNTGKSQFGRFLSELIGRDNVETLRSINDFRDKWTTGQISDKKLATCLDLPNQQLSEDAVGALKQLVGDDSVKGEKKRGQPFTFYRKPLLLCAGNYPIRIPNGDQAVLNRMIVIPFANPCEEDRMILLLYKELLDESPYIIREAIAAYEDLAERNFQVTRAEVPLEYQPEVYLTPIQIVEKFVSECCVLEDGLEITTANLYRAYRVYTGENGFVPLADNVFSRTLSQLVGINGWSLESQKRVTGTNDRGYKGIGLVNQ